MPIAVSDPGEQIAAMAEFMISTFGQRAGAVAQAQVDQAVPDQPAVAATWRRIGTMIDDRLTRNQVLPIDVARDRER